VKRQDWLLLALAAAQDKGLTPVQLQKSLFLFEKGLNRLANFYHFVPYNYGPFDAQIYRDADSLSQLGLVESRTGGRRWPQYYITAAGQGKAREAQEQLSAEVLAYVNNTVAWTQRLSFPDLVRAIYQKYPEYRANSIFQQ
jgi:uncharacterized protein YwgA